MIASLLVLVIVAAMAGVILWGMEQWPIDATLKTIVRVGVIVVLVLWILVHLLHMVGGTIP